MRLDKQLEVKGIAKTREDISKKRIVELYDFLTDKTATFFGVKSKTDISVHRNYLDSVSYDSLEEFQKNFSDLSELETVNLISSVIHSECVYLSIRYSEFSNNPKLPVSAYISASCYNKTEAEVEDLLLEIKKFIIDLFSSPEEKSKKSDTNNTQPTDKGNEKFWVKYKPLVEFVSLVLGILVVLFGFFKSCNDNIVNDEVNENQTFYSQQNEISTDADNSSLLS